MTKNNDVSEYVTESIIDREMFEKLPVEKRPAYILNCVVDEIDEAVQSRAFMCYEGACNPLVGILQQAKAESGIAITLQVAMRQYRNRQNSCAISA